jgi:hypothetical protein
MCIYKCLHFRNRKIYVWVAVSVRNLFRLNIWDEIYLFIQGAVWSPSDSTLQEKIRSIYCWFYGCETWSLAVKFINFRLAQRQNKTECDEYRNRVILDAKFTAPHPHTTTKPGLLAPQYKVLTSSCLSADQENLCFGLMAHCHHHKNQTLDVPEPFTSNPHLYALFLWDLALILSSPLHIRLRSALCTISFPTENVYTRIPTPPPPRVPPISSNQ